MVDVAIVTIKREEFDALLEQFTVEMESPSERLAADYKFRSVSHKGSTRAVAITRCVMQGNGDAQTVIGRAIKDLDPTLVLVVGIAGAPPSNDVFLGDIVLGTHVHDFNLAAETPNGVEFAEHGISPPYWLTRYACNLDLKSPAYADWHLPLGERPKTSAGLLEFSVPSDSEWNNKIASCVKHHESRQIPKVADGPIASSDDLLKTPNSVRRRLAIDRQIIAVEMESAGAARACTCVAQHEPAKAFLPIRAISDIPGLKREPAWERYACRAAALFTLKFIEQLPDLFFTNRGDAPSRSAQIVQVATALQAANMRPLPLAVVTSALGLNESELQAELKGEIATGQVVVRDHRLDIISTRRADHDFSLPEAATFLTPLLESLLHHIHTNAETEEGIGQVRGAVLLAKTVLNQASYLAHRVFDTLDHPMKAIGDKALVRDIAQICIDAAGKRQHDPEAAECIARARICGLSWYYQPTNQLDLAQDEARKSLELGQRLGYKRNDAFCHKCLGRLLRMRAEQATAPADRKRFLEDSVGELLEAIQIFSELPDIGSEHLQVGDCFSLLGRTHLFSGDLAQARNAAREAGRRITDDASKAFLDLQILLGDLALKLGGKSPITFYSSVIDQEPSGSADYEKSEIVARALFHRGIARLSDSEKSLAKQDFESAAQVWNSLDEGYFASQAQWEAIKIQENIPTKTLLEIEKEHPEIRVKAHEWINERAQAKSRKVVGQRKQHDLLTWKQALKAARERVALEKYQ